MARELDFANDPAYVWGDKGSMDPAAPASESPNEKMTPMSTGMTTTMAILAGGIVYGLLRRNRALAYGSGLLLVAIFVLNEMPR
jgi:hypothetical protein